MSTEIATYQFPITDAPVRAVELNGEPWFVAADVTDILGYSHGRDQVNALPQRMRNTVAISDGKRGNPNRTVVNEAGVYRLAMRSNLPEAEAFQNWLAEDVIPAIRRTGRYESPGAALATTAPVIDVDMQARVIATLAGVIAPDYLEAKARIVLARALGEQPEIDPAKRPLTVADYFAERGATGEQDRKLSSRFGKAIKALYIAKHDRAPEQITDRWINGSVRKVNAYTEADRALFDAAWSQMFPPALGAA